MKNTPEIALLYCRHCMSEDKGIAVEAEKATGFFLRPVMLPCSSKIQVSDILKILSEGADAVEIVACPENKCRFLTGSRKAEKRVTYANRLLEQSGIKKKYVGITIKHDLSAEELIQIAEARAKEIINDNKGEEQ